MSSPSSPSSEIVEPPAARRRFIPVALGLAALVILILSLAWSKRGEPGLNEDQARNLQEIEHLGGFVLGDLALPQIADALRDGDPTALTSALAEDFTGRVFRDPAKTSDHGFARISTWQRDNQETASGDCDAEELVAWMMKHQQSFEQLESVGLKVKLMEPVTSGKLDGPWHGTLRLRMAGRGADNGLREIRMQLACRLNGLDDELPNRKGWLKRLEVRRVDVSESDAPLMEEMTLQTGIQVARLQDNWKGISGQQTPTLTGGVYLADYDGDRQIDCLLTDLRGLALYRGLGGGRFRNVTAAVGLPASHTDLQAVWADFDNDGDPDLILDRRIYRNAEGRRFEPLDPSTTGLELEDNVGFAVADVDRDGLVDLYVVGINHRTSGQKWIGTNDSNRNQLWHNQGDLTFTNSTASSGTAGSGTSTFAAVFFDANADGWPDLMTACEFGENDFWLNNGDGTFARSPLPEIYGGFSMGLTVGDIDNDGRADPYLANMYSKAGERIVANLPRGIYTDDVDRKLRDFVTGSELYHNNAKGGFTRIGQQAGVADVGWAYGPAYVDLDNDGQLDLYAPAGFQSVTPDRPDG